MKLHKHTDLIFTIDNFCTPQECEEMVAHSVETGYSPATIITAEGTRLVPEYRNNTRVFHTSFDMADMLWRKLEPMFTINVGKSKPVGLNELFRFYKYEPGQRFRKHRDSHYSSSETEGSFYTFLLYLNEGYKGGETAFTYEGLVIRPKTGMALIFYHELMHEGFEVLEGVKFVLRSDIMYRYMPGEGQN